MDAISSFFDGLKERFTNPFISSFVIAWLLVNWDVTVSILWVDTPQGLLTHEYLIKLIRDNYQTWNYIELPLWIAFGYTVVFPFIKVLISSIGTLAGRFSDFMDIKILKSATAPMSKFINLRKQYDEQTEQLGKLIALESPTTAKNLELETSVQQYKVAHIDLTQQLANERKANGELRGEINSVSDVQLFTGKWTVISTDLQNGTEEHWRMEISINGQVSVFYEDGNSKLEWQMRGIRVSKSRNRVSFVFARHGAIFKPDNLVTFSDKRDTPFYFITYYYELKTTVNFELMEGFQHSEKTFHKVEFIREMIEHNPKELTRLKREIASIN